MYNIRSYTNKEVVFPEGSILLWGNIGSGKSSILLAVDFAFFGLQRGNLSGASLLRNGADAGYVELSFTIDDEEIVLLRALKRSKTSVVQDSGYIIRNGVKEEKTAIELKQAVLDLLNYPMELLTKNKALIYRYTVYTPQEEMKSILLGSKEERLDTLRKVFGVDKYKRVKVNAKLVATKLRELKRLYEGASADLQDKVFELEEKEKEKIIVEKELEESKPKVVLFKGEVEKKKKEVYLVESKREEVQTLKQELSSAQGELKHMMQEKRSDSLKLEALEKELESMEAEVLEIDESLLEKIELVSKNLKDKEIESRQNLNKIQELSTKVSHSQHIGKSVTKLVSCPVCFQEVGDAYKDKVMQDKNKEVENFEREKKEIEIKQEIVEKEIVNLKSQLEEYKKSEANLQLVKVKLKQRDSKRQEVVGLRTKSLAVKQNVAGMNSRIIELQGLLEEFKVLEEMYPKLKEELDFVQEKYRKAELESHRLQACLEPLTKQLESLVLEVEKKKRMRAKQESINKSLFWLTEEFMILMDSMEKNILFKVHAEFSALFEKWFDILVDSDDMQMTLDEEYSPKILQNGYDIEYEHLSGGEKTAGALAYRLALNQVINTLNAGLKTNDVLILDEPTDGFSQEQLDRLKVLMEEIKIPQIIIVSHEPQIEAFVDNIIRLEKVGHETKVI